MRLAESAVYYPKTQTIMQVVVIVHRECISGRYACFHKFGVLVVGVLVTGALLFGISYEAIWARAKTPYQDIVEGLCEILIERLLDHTYGVLAMAHGVVSCVPGEFPVDSLRKNMKSPAPPRLRQRLETSAQDTRKYTRFPKSR